MNKRRLGKTDIEIAPLALGTNVFGWTIDEQQSFSILDQFIDAGMSLVDTADVYSRWGEGHKGGESETIIGNWLKKTGRRKDIVLATKVGSDMGDGKKGLSRAYIIGAAEASLKRLQTDYIDLYQTHFDDNVTPVDETLAAYEELIKAGKVRYIGASNVSPGRLTRSLEASKQHNYPSYQSLQPEYNLYAREKYEQEYEQICKDNNMGVICYYSLASGFLTGKYRTEKDFSKSVRGGGMSKYLNDRGKRILGALDEVSAAHSSTPAAVALAWLIARPSITAPIASATKKEQVDELVNATKLQLDKASIDKLDAASAY